MSKPSGPIVAGVRAGWRVTKDKSERHLARLVARLIDRNARGRKATR